MLCSFWVHAKDAYWLCTIELFLRVVRASSYKATHPALLLHQFWTCTFFVGNAILAL